MVSIRNTNEIILSLIDFYRTVKPNLNTNPGSYTNDVFISPLASQLSLLYDQISNISSKQSLRLVIGSDLDKFAKNFGISRAGSTSSSGVVLATFSSLNANFSIKKNDVFISNNGVSFVATSNIPISISNSNFYKSIALKYKNDLDANNITDVYAVEVPLVCSNAGTIGNIAKYSMSRTNVSGINNVINPNSFGGGSDKENDAIFRDRILSVFTGSSVGTNLGYLNSTLAVSGVLDAFVVEPGDTLMTRDGTVVNKALDGTLTIVSEGSGGKVDIVVLGDSNQETTDSFIFLDKSNESNISNSKNDYTIGQISGEENKSIKRKRIDNIKAGVLPNQPISAITKVSGSLSGSNFKEKTVDSYGRVSGNYELLKDSGYYSESPWALDKLHWISDRIEEFQEDRIKNQIYGQDTLNFTGTIRIPKVTQQVQILNENSKITSDRSIIQLLHYPVTNVTRVFNTNTGERYIVSNQNPDGSGSINTTGRIKISGGTLPTQSTTLQVDYSWVVDYDSTLDYDGLENTRNIRSVSDSIDWGYSGIVRDEKIKLTLDSGGSFYSGKSLLPINNIVSCFQYDQFVSQVYKITSGVYVDRLAVTISNINVEPASVYKVTKLNTNIDVYNTNSADYKTSSSTSLFGLETVYNLTIILPSDTTVIENNYVSIYLNSSEIFSVDDVVGSFSNFDITIPIINTTKTAEEIYVLVNYISNAQNVYNSSITNLPNSLFNNGLYSAQSQKTSNITNPIFSESLKVKTNTNSELYIETSLTSDLFDVSVNDVLTIVKVSNNFELWNSAHLGSIALSDANKVQLILSGYNSPVDGDVVTVVMIPKQISRFQPITRQSNNIQYSLCQGSSTVAISNFIVESEIEFSISSMSDGYEIVSYTDGYVSSTDDNICIFSSLTYSFSLLDNVKNYIVKIKSGSNIGDHYVLDYEQSDNTITIGNDYNNTTINNYSLIKIADAKEIPITSVDYTNNRLNINNTSTNILSPDKFVLVKYENNILRTSYGRLSLSVSDQVINAGSVNIYGDTIYKATDVVFSQIYNDYKVNLSEAIKTAMGKNSNYQIPSGIKLVGVVDLRKVTTDSNNIVISEVLKYDLYNAKLSNNNYYNNELDSSINQYDLVIPKTSINTINKPSIGDKLMCSFYYVLENDSETLSFTRNSTLYTNKKFANIKKMAVSSGFKSSLSTKLNVNLFNQPSTNSRYSVYYDYTAPKQNERITVDYTYNKLISDVQLAIEASRPINADVLVKASSKVIVDVSILIYVDSSVGLSETSVKQNVSNAITSTVNVLALGRTLDDIDITNAADATTGVLKSKILYFNVSGSSGSVSKIVAQKNEYFNIGTVSITSEIR
jgi:hypothetical protein